MDTGGLEEQLGHRFAEPALLELALTHPSITHDRGNASPHNQRLEFLGDAVLQLVLTRALFERFPALGEGLLTQARAELVNRRSLTAQGRALGLGPHLILSRAEEQCGGRARPGALADAFEAVLGALFLDGGLPTAERFILGRFQASFSEVAEATLIDNPKGALQERLQANAPEPPIYQVVGAQGPDHDRHFECLVSYRGRPLGRGAGRSKKDAESAAARAALMALESAGEAPLEAPGGGGPWRGRSEAKNPLTEETKHVSSDSDTSI